MTGAVASSVNSPANTTNPAASHTADSEAARTIMNAVHIKTSGFYCKACPKVVESALTAVVGVEDVVSVHSMGLTSVLFDPDKVDASSLCARIRAAGFGAEIYCPHHSADADSPGETCGRPR